MITMDKIEAMGMEINTERCTTGSFIVKGENEKLQTLKQMLDDDGYTDDSPVACPLLGFTPAKESISFMMICNFGGNNNGYMAVA